VIAFNAGNAARTCAATRVPMHLVEPLGFELDSGKCAYCALLYCTLVLQGSDACMNPFLYQVLMQISLGRLYYSAFHFPCPMCYLRQLQK
jgi:tRNA(Leu) C34 or U34 (ribose-2'-O)-methylase TrmL